MNLRTPQSRRRLFRAFTLVEILVATTLGMLVLAVVAMLSLYGARSLAALVNYTDLDTKSRYALDVISREIRQAKAVIAVQTNLPVMSLTLTNTDQSAIVKLTYDSNARTLVLSKTGQPDLTALTECDNWNFSLYQEAPTVTATNIIFYPATNNAGNLDPTLCKLINMSWKCSRQILAQKVNTESVQTAQIVLRNQH
ncbi:MAG TPA: prepilin-type N-terminal cleavage/methylation domain-containing protein [Verrucomicrobiae bacterium]|nr:prepilin-type N-terminal cleavage/methylation domain-containing protein [Verrucomicrobiae bacterium]